MPLQATSGAASYDAFGGGVPVVPQYIEEVFSTYLYTGTGAAQTITNDIDLAGKGGLIWIKGRTGNSNNMLWDSVSTANLSSNTTDASGNSGTFITGTSSSGFSINNNSRVSQSTYNYVGWTFRKQPKFFDVVTYTGTGGNRTINHNLGSEPGCIIIKDTSSPYNWTVYHRSLAYGEYLVLNSTAAKVDTSGDNVIWNVTSTSFNVASSYGLSYSGDSYVAYVFAHNAGGFGLTGTDNVISCGSCTAGTPVNLGYEPQWILLKNPNSSGSGWKIYDNMRGGGLANYVNQNALEPNTSGAESANGQFSVSATGFTFEANAIYIAIRRGPMKVPTVGTSVFGAQTWTGNGASPRTFTSVNWTFPADLVTVKGTDNSAWWNQWSPRLTGGTLATNDTGAEQTASTSIAGYVSSFNQTGYTATSGSSSISNYNANADTYVSYNIRRAPSFMDVVCYTNTGSSQQVAFTTLGTTPELVIYKARGTTSDWYVLGKVGSLYHGLKLNSTAASAFNDTAANLGITSTYFDPAFGWGGPSSFTYVAYFFATCAGVSKVGSYTGTGALQTVNCGFTSGARFVMIKRTDSTGGWFYYDSVRGITSGNDPYLFFNSSNQQVTNTNFVDTDTTGFKVTASAPAEMNASGGTYIFLAIA